MAEITIQDAKILLVTALAVVSMSLVFPALGLTDESAVTASEIPEFNVTTDRFAFAGSAPELPNTPTSGTLRLNTSDVQFSKNVVWLSGTTETGYEMALFDNGQEAEVRLNEWNGTLEGYNSVNVSEGDRAILERDAYEVEIRATEDMNASGGIYEVDWELRNQPQAGGEFISRIPVVGGIFSAGEAIAGVVAWGFSIVYWFGQVALQGILNAGGAVLDVTGYLFGITAFVATTYTAIVTASASWAAVFVALPGIIFSIIFAKFVAVGLSMIPFN